MTDLGALLPGLRNRDRLEKKLKESHEFYARNGFREKEVMVEILMTLLDIDIPQYD